MPKLYTLHNCILAILALAFGLFVFLNLTPVHAQTVIPGPGGSATIVGPGGNTFLPPTGGGTVFDDPLSPGGAANNPPGGGGGANAGGGGGAGGGASGATTLSGQTPDPQVNLGNTDGSLTSSQGLSMLTKFVYGILITIGGLFAWFGGMLLDFSIKLFVVEMGYRLANENFGFTVNAIWTIIRDLFNILFIFALIFIGLKTILNSDDSSVKRDLGMLIVAALLINFSLLFTKMVVDFSNIAAIEIYQAFQVTGSGPLTGLYQGVTGSNPAATSSVTSVSSVFMDHFNLATYADRGSVIAYADNPGLLNWKVFGFGFLMMIMMIIAGFVFLSGAVLLIYRFVALVIYLMFSPALFLGWIYPGFNSQSQRYWRGFLRNAFVAPAYLFMLYICARLFDGMQGRDTMNFASAFENASFFAVFAYFAVMIFFLIAATRVASYMGAAGADMTARIGNYGASFVYRNTAGVASGGALRTFDALGNRGGVVGRVAQGALGGESTRRAIESARGYSLPGTQSRVQVLADRETVKKRRETNVRERATAAAEDQFKLKISKNAGKTDAQSRIALGDAVSGASSSQLLKILKDNEPGSKEYEAVVASMSQSQYEKLMDAKPEEFDDAQKAKLAAAKQKFVGTRLTAGGTSIADAIPKASLDDLSVLDLQEQILPNAAKLQASQIEKMKDNSHFKGPRYDIIKNAYEDAIQGMNYGDVIESRTSDENIAKLPAKFIAKNPQQFAISLGTRGKLTNELLTKIALRDDLEGTLKKQIGDGVKSFFTGRGSIPQNIQQFFSGGPGTRMN